MCSPYKSKNTPNVGLISLLLPQFIRRIPIMIYRVQTQYMSFLAPPQITPQPTSKKNQQRGYKIDERFIVKPISETDTSVYSVYNPPTSAKVDYKVITNASGMAKKIFMISGSPSPMFSLTYSGDNPTTY